MAKKRKTQKPSAEQVERTTVAETAAVVTQVAAEVKKENSFISALKWIVGSGVLTLAVSQGPNLWQRYSDYRHNITEAQRITREEQKKIALQHLMCINNDFVVVKDESKNELKIRICDSEVVLIEFPNKDKDSTYKFIQIDKVSPDLIAMGALFAETPSQKPTQQKQYTTTNTKQIIKILCKKEVDSFILFYVKNMQTGKCNVNKFNAETGKMTNNLSDRPIDCNKLCKD